LKKEFLDLKKEFLDLKKEFLDLKKEFLDLKKEFLDYLDFIKVALKELMKKDELRSYYIEIINIIFKYAIVRIEWYDSVMDKCDILEEMDAFNEKLILKMTNYENEDL